MSATVQINRLTGPSPGTPTDITGINSRANAGDFQSTNDTTAPIQVPLIPGTNYSFWVSTRLNAITTPAGTINNIRWFTDGVNSFGTGVTSQCAKASTGADAGYRQATGVTGNGTQLTQANHTGLDEAPADIFTFTSLAPKSLNGSISNPNTGLFGDFLVYQLSVNETGQAGPTGSEVINWRYDES